MTYQIFHRIKIPCGAIASYDEGSGYGYRCEDCMAVVGSIGQPRECKDKALEYKLIEKLGGPGWNYAEHVVKD